MPSSVETNFDIEDNFDYLADYMNYIDVQWDDLFEDEDDDFFEDDDYLLDEENHSMNHCYCCY